MPKINKKDFFEETSENITVRSEYEEFLKNGSLKPLHIGGYTIVRADNFTIPLNFTAYGANEKDANNSFTISKECMDKYPFEQGPNLAEYQSKMLAIKFPKYRSNYKLSVINIVEGMRGDYIKNPSIEEQAFLDLLCEYDDPNEWNRDVSNGTVKDNANMGFISEILKYEEPYGTTAIINNDDRGGLFVLENGDFVMRNCKILSKHDGKTLLEIGNNFQIVKKAQD